MDRLLTHPSFLIGIVGGLIITGALSALFFIKKIFKFQKKDLDDRALLKELLEGFGLEIPPELDEPEATVIKSIKSS